MTGVFRELSLPRKAVLAAGALIGVCLALLVLGLGAALLALRTPWAEARLSDLLVRSLAGQGYTLKVQALSGPLPGRLLLRGAEIADRDGPLARIAELEVEINPGALCAGVVEASLRLREPELLRLPPSAAAPPAAGGGELRIRLPELDLPVAVRLSSLRLEGARLSAAALLPAQPDAVFPGIGPMPEFLRLDGELSASLAAKRLAAALRLALATDTEQELRAEAELHMEPGKAAAALRGGLLLALRGAASSERRTVRADYAVGAEFADSVLRVTRLELSAPGVRVSGNGAAPAQGGKAEGELSLALDDAPLRDALPAGLAALLPPEAFGGMLNLRGTARFPESFTRIDGRADLEGKNLRWPVAQAARLLGRELKLSAGFSGGEGLPWTLRLEELRAGLLRVAGELSAARQQGEPAGSERLRARLDLELEDLAPLRGPFSGPLRAALQAQGSLAALDAEFELSGPDLKQSSAALRGLALRADAAYRRAPSGEARAFGKCALSAKEGPGGPGEFTFSWRAALAADASPLSAQLDAVRARIAGLELGGALRAVFAQGVPDVRPLPRLAGSLDVKIADFAPLAALAGLELRGGPLSARLGLEHADSGQRAALAVQFASFSFGKAAAAARNLTLNVKADRLWTEPALALDLRGASGAAGPLRWESLAASLEGARNGRFALALRGGLLPRDASGNMRKNAADAAGKRTKNATGAATSDAGALSLSGGYDAAERKVVISRFVLNAPQRGAGLRLLEPLTLHFAEGLRVTGLKAGFQPAGRLTAEADLRPGSPRIEARLTEFSPLVLRLLFGAALPAGALDAHARYAVTAAGPEGGLNLRARIAAPANASPALTLRADAAFERGAGKLRLRGNGSFGLAGAAGDEGALSFVLPLALGDNGLPEPEMNAPVSAALRWESPVAPLWRFVPLPGRTLDGRFAVQFSAAGTLASPALSGSAHLAGGRFEDKVAGVLLSGIELEARGDSKNGGRLVLAAEDGAEGSLALEAALRPGADSPLLALRGSLRRLSPLHRDDLSLTLSGSFRAEGALNAPALGADIVVERGEVNLLALSGGGVRTLDIAEAGEARRTETDGAPLALNISVPNRFFIRGRGMDSEWQGRLGITGSADQPALTGALRPVRGTFEVLAKTFEFTGGAITFGGGTRINPGVNLELTHAGPDITAVISVNGSAQKPVLALSSRPPLPRDEVLAHVLFGKNLSELSRFESLQLVEGLREMAGVGPGGSPLSSTRKKLGLDVLRLGGGQADAEQRADSGISGAANAPVAAQGATGAASASQGAPSLEAGKYISDGIYVGLEQGASPESTGARVEIELLPNVNIQGTSTPTSSRIGIGWKKDY